MELPSRIIEIIVKINSSSAYRPDENKAILNITPKFLNYIVNVNGLSDETKRYLFSISDKLRKRSKDTFSIHINDEGTSLDVTEWFPRTTFNAYQKQISECSFFILDKDTDLNIGVGGYVSWLSRADKKINMTSIVPAKYCLNINKSRWGLDFSDPFNALYELNGIGIRNSVGVCICISFYPPDKIENEQFILYEKGESSGNIRGISIVSSGIKLWGVNNDLNHEFINIELTGEKRTCVTLFIEYPGLDENQQGRYFLNRETKANFFSFKDSGIFDENCYIGGKLNDRSNSSNFFQGALISLDIFYKNNIKVPIHLINLIINNHIIKRT